MTWEEYEAIAKGVAQQAVDTTRNEPLEIACHVWHRKLLLEAGLPPFAFDVFYRSFRVAQAERGLKLRRDSTIEDDVHEAVSTALGRYLTADEIERLAKWLKNYAAIWRTLDDLRIEASAQIASSL